MTLLLLLSTDCFNAYSEGMKNKLEEKSLDKDQPYFTQLDLKLAHDDFKDKALLKLFVDYFTFKKIF